MNTFKILGFEVEKNKLIISIFIFIFLTIFSLFFTSVIVFFLEKMPFNKFNISTILSLLFKKKSMQLFLLLEILSLMISLIFLVNNNWYKSKQKKITDKISIPVEVGQKQHGSARFLEKKEYDKVFDFEIIDLDNISDIVKNSDEIYNFIEENKEKIDKLIDEMD